MKIHDYRDIKVNPEFTNLSSWVNVCELLKTQPSWEVYDTCLEAYWPEPDIDVVIRLDKGHVAEVSCNYMQMVLCVLCGNKRCPHSTNHNYECTGSNEAGQPGSRYPK